MFIYATVTSNKICSDFLNVINWLRFRNTLSGSNPVIFLFTVFQRINLNKTEGDLSDVT
jgi:hypothetical protein